MKHSSITWELALPVIGIIVFILLVEAWKLSKRVCFRRLAKKHPEEEDDSMSGVFAAWKTMDGAQTGDARDATVIV